MRIATRRGIFSRVPGIQSRLRLGIITAASLLTAAGASAQGGGGATSSRPGWLPRAIQIEGGITAGQRADAVARLEQFAQILQRIPQLANPQGFEIEPVFYGGARRLGRAQAVRDDFVVEYMLSLTFYVPTKAIAHEGCRCISIRVNPTAVPGESGITDEQGRTIWVEAEQGDPIPGATQVYERLPPTEPGAVYVLFTPGGDTPWRQATREEYFEAWIWELDGKDGAKLSDASAELQQTPYQSWLDGAAQRKKEREDLYRSLAPTLTAEDLARTRQTMEDAEREVGEQLKASEADDQAANAAGLAAVNARSASVRAQRDAMSADERRMPAFIEAALSEGGPITPGFRMADREGPGVRRVLTPDYDYWRVRRSPVDARAILVEIGVAGSGMQPPVHRALLEAFDALDWAAVAKLLDSPR